EQSARRLRFLLDSTTLLAATLDYDASLSELARLCVAELADWVVIYGFDRDGQPCRLEVAHRDPQRAALARALRDMPLDASPSNPVIHALRERKSMLAREV